MLMEQGHGNRTSHRRRNAVAVPAVIGRMIRRITLPDVDSLMCSSTGRDPVRSTLSDVPVLNRQLTLGTGASLVVLELHFITKKFFYEFNVYFRNKNPDNWCSV